MGPRRSLRNASRSRDRDRDSIPVQGVKVKKTKTRGPATKKTTTNVEKRGRGRPPKPASVAAAVEPEPTNVQKRGKGRPPRRLSVHVEPATVTINPGVPSLVTSDTSAARTIPVAANVSSTSTSVGPNRRRKRSSLASGLADVRQKTLLKCRTFHRFKRQYMVHTIMYTLGKYYLKTNAAP